MGGQVLGGGVIVLVAALLWLVYLLPTWHSRRQFDAAERNAVRLNQALRVLAETSEVPGEVRLELNARTAMAQQRLARQAMAERESAALEHAKADLERARSEHAAVRAIPAVRQARARRRLRLAATSVALAAIGVAVWGAIQVVTTGAQLLLWAGVLVAIAAGLLLQRMSQVGARAAAKTMDAATRAPAHLQDVELEREPRVWAPRELPRPLTASAGSRASAVLEAEAAREALRQAALEEAMRERAAAQRPPSIDVARTARAGGSEYSQMGYVDDAEIEAHVRDLLSRRAAGQ
ncbi:large exoprotein [Microbacterium sp. CFBP9034]|uniref:large exoprotein n=1 Tax=Microbacterium sp. CFBP9034 TaxID=3096540 RepID=UPI002A6A9E65|nr:large exoprotein [Microbacterium sp. CFBP9034]MDY0910918.1 large exoprotein [Microbacterium sp. CFBP9034]